MNSTLNAAGRIKVNIRVPELLHPIEYRALKMTGQ
jgi:hypothetical protein